MGSIASKKQTELESERYDARADSLEAMPWNPGPEEKKQIAQTIMSKFEVILNASAAGR
jgi:hypothetical protein